MIIFWLFSGLLLCAALAFILAPQLRTRREPAGVDRTRLNVGLYQERLHELESRRETGALDTAQFEAARAEAARGLLDDVQRAEPAAGAPLGKAIPRVVALSVPLLALALYFHWGSLDQLMWSRQHRGEPAQSIEKVTARLEALLAERPDSAEGWSLLARAYVAQNRMADAARAFERASELAGSVATRKAQP